MAPVLRRTGERAISLEINLKAASTNNFADSLELMNTGLLILKSIVVLLLNLSHKFNKFALLGAKSRNNVDIGTHLITGLAGNDHMSELDIALSVSMKGVILASNNVHTRMELETTLTDDDVANLDLLFTILLHTETTTGGIGLVNDSTTGLLSGSTDDFKVGHSSRRREGRTN